MLGTLTKQLMKKAVAFGGDGLKTVTVRLVADSTYDPDTGEQSVSEVDVIIDGALMGRASQADSKRYNVTMSTFKVVVAALDFSGPFDPEATDRLVINNKVWLIERVVVGSMEHSYTFFIYSN